MAESSEDSDEGTWHPEREESSEEEEEEEEEVDDEVCYLFCLTSTKCSECSEFREVLTWTVSFCAGN